MVNAVLNIARKQNLKRVWLVTTNDNLSAQNFYLKKGFKIIAVYKDAMKQARKLKPQIPLIGINGIL